MRVPIARVDPTLPLPRYATEGSVGFDLITRETTRIEPGAIGLVPANVIIAAPPGFMVLVAARSSTPRRTGLVAAHGVGIIDRDYCGPDDEIHVQFWNPTDKPIEVERGTRIAQAILVRVDTAEWVEGEPEGAESRGGFGSTGE